MSRFRTDHPERFRRESPVAVAPTPSAPAIPTSQKANRQAPTKANDLPMDLGILGILLGMYVMMLTIPLAELISNYGHFNLRIVAVTWVLVTLGAAFTGRLDRFLSVPLSKVWIALAALLILSSMVSIYRRESIPFILDYVVRFQSVPILICAIAVRPQHIGKLMSWAGFSSLILLLVCFLFGETTEGRFAITETSLRNPNDLGLWLLMSSLYFLPLLVSRFKPKRLIWLGSFPVVLYYVFRTGSRADFLALLFAIVVVLWVVPRRVKIVGVTLLILAGMVLAIALPSTVWQRLTLIVSDAEQTLREHPEFSHEVGSQLARIRLQERALQVILEHPVLGVGANQFAGAVEDMTRRETGQKSTWQVAHNAYLQMAAESGVVAGLLYMISIFLCFRMNLKSFRYWSNNTIFQTQSLALLMITCCLGFGLFFSNFTYEPVLPLLVGLSSANFLARS
jgi:O-antigen ligase